MTEIRNKRIMAALNMEKPDRIPINLSGQGFFKWIDPKAVLADLFRNPKYTDELTLQAFQLPIINEIDSAPMIGFTTEAGMTAFAATSYFAKIKIPGRDLPEDAIWNIDEVGPMTAEDYDTVIDKGWEYMTAELYKRIGFDPASMPPPDMEYTNELNAKIAALGKTSLEINPFLPMPSFEVISGARKMPEFFKDLRRIPDKVKAVIDIVDEAAINKMVGALKSGPPCAYGFIGGTRAGSDFISARVYEKYYHPFYHKIVPAMREVNVKTWFHNDSDWSGFLQYFTEFPKAQCIFDPDHLTPMEKLKEVLGDRMCIEGNIPPALLAVGTPDDCYKAARDLIDLMGDTGFMMGVGCGVPVNAKRENVEAVILATLGK
jgi:uroporphyrinogen-III decarboxylase